ncbi:MAG: hypothetical protein ACM37V_06445, partial [Gemmatimonadota bacterium]
MSAIKLFERYRIYLLVAAVTVAAGCFLLEKTWIFPGIGSQATWNALVAFAALAILCDTSFLRISFANINSSVAFIPLMTSIMLFEHPWPMLVSGVTAFSVDT